MRARPTRLVLRKEPRTAGADRARLYGFKGHGRKKPLVLGRVRSGADYTIFAMLPHRE